MIVADTNVIAYLFLPGDATPDARRALRRDPEWAAPVLWRSELRNVLAMALRGGGMALADAYEVMELAGGLFSGREYQVDSPLVLRLAAASACSAYDCEFVALAQDLGVPLVTGDRRLRARFARTAVSLRDFAGGR
ncbi:MAG TPA: type II toxin-antitoxin system VapC family toxin [Gemmatimonadales bacterium]|nr:type II toxin-antitoxin system VapC family toxin [Gemmatimonadales bacterium]